MIQIEISEATFEKLQRLAIPLVDTMDSLLDRLARLNSCPQQTRDDFRQTLFAPSNISARQVLKFSAAAPPNLTHTKVVAIRFDGRPVTRGLSWAGLLREAIRRLPKEAKARESLRHLVIVNFVEGKKSGEGFRYLPEANISIQGQDAPDAAKGAFHVAAQMGWQLEVEFVWRDKPAAAHPGKVGLLASD